MPITGVKWQNTANDITSITWSFGDFQIDLSNKYSGYKVFDTRIPDDYRYLIQKAFDAWEAVAKIDFVQISDSASSNIRIGNEYIDGSNPNGDSILGRTQTWYSGSAYVAAEVYFDGDAYSSAERFYEVAVHEIGHAIGLEHSSNPSDVMYPSTNAANLSGKLSSTDLSSVQSIYGAKQSVPVPPSSGFDVGFAAAASSIFFIHKNPTAEEFASRSDFMQKQLDYYANVLRTADPKLGPYEAFGAAVSGENYFRSEYSLNTYNTEAFIRVAYNKVFQFVPSDAVISALSQQITYFKGLYQGAGMSLMDAEYKARGAVAGQIVGYAMNSPSYKAQPNITLDDEANMYLSAASHSAVLGTESHSAQAGWDLI